MPSWYGPAGADGALCREECESCSNAESKLEYDARFYQKEGIVFDCGVQGRGLALHLQSGRPVRLCVKRARPQLTLTKDKFVKRGVVSYRFRKIKESI